MLEEEKTADEKTRSMPKFESTHPTNTINLYINDKYDVVKNAFFTDKFTKVSNTVIVYHVLFMELKDHSKQENRDIKLEFKNGIWNITSDVIVKK